MREVNISRRRLRLYDDDADDGMDNANDKNNNDENDDDDDDEAPHHSPASVKLVPDLGNLDWGLTLWPALSFPRTGYYASQPRQGGRPSGRNQLA